MGPIPSISYVACFIARIPALVFHPLVLNIAFFLWEFTNHSLAQVALLEVGLVGCFSLSLFPSPPDRYLGYQDAGAKTSERPSGQWPGCGSCKAGMDTASFTPQPEVGGL